MPQLDLSGFVTPEETFSGLDNITSSLQRNNILKQQEADRQERLANAAEAKRNATATYLQGYLNPKHFLTGTVLDPLFTQGLSDIMGRAMNLASQGVDTPTITMAINPMVADLAKSSQNVQALNVAKQSYLKNLGKDPGIDPNKFDDAFQKEAFYNTDSKGNKTLKTFSDLASIDPTQAADMAGRVLTNSDVYTNGGLNNFMKTAKPEVNDFNNKVRDASGKVTQVKGVQTAAPFMQPDLDQAGVYTGKFVPHYEIATDGDSPLIHTFKDDTGKDIQAPVRMITEDVYKSLPASAQGYLMQEVRKQIADHPDIKLNSVQAEHLGRAIAYDEMKNSPDNWSTYKRTDVNLQPLPEKSTTNNYFGNMQPPVVDLYNGDSTNKGVKQIIDEGGAKGKGFTYTPFNTLPIAAQNIILKAAKENSNDKTLNYSNVYVNKLPNGDEVVRKVPDDGKITYKNATDPDYLYKIDPLSLNIPGNQNLSKVGTGKTKPSTMNKVVDESKQKTNTQGGMSDADYENFLKKNKLK